MKPTLRDIESFPSRFGSTVAFLCAFTLFLLGAVGVSSVHDPQAAKVYGVIAVTGLVIMTRIAQGRWR